MQTTDASTGSATPKRRLKRVGPETGLSKAHISPRYVGGSAIEIYPDGSLLKVQRDREEQGSHTRGVRGDIRRFTRSSSRRLKQRLAKVRRDFQPVFVTLTYPDVWFWDGEQIKRDLDRLGKRFLRRFPRWSFVWKLELKQRRSGALEGTEMPHFHLLVYGPDSAAGFTLLKRFISTAWPGVVGAEDYPELDELRRELRGDEVVRSNAEDHAIAGYRTEMIRSFRGTMSYAAKYFDKDEEAPEFAGIGRFWGVVGRSNFPVAQAVAFLCSDWQARRVLRVLKRLRGQDCLRYSMWHICDAGQWWLWLDRLLSPAPG